jgi:hypothetical protein
MANVNETALSAAWQQLEVSLREANKLFLNRADGGRAAAFYQLSAINRFISAVSDNDRLLQMPLFALNVALYYLELGVVEPMLAPKGNKSRRGRRPEQGVLKVRSAVAMSQLYGIGYRRKEAARRIANELTNLGRFPIELNQCPHCVEPQRGDEATHCSARQPWIASLRSQ